MKTKRILLGNPLIAVTMLKHDLTAGLAVPVELLLLEKKEGGVDLIYQLPSALLAGLVAELDRKFERLVEDIAA